MKQPVPSLGCPVGRRRTQASLRGLHASAPAPASWMGAAQHLSTGRPSPTGRGTLGIVTPMLMAVVVAT